MTAHGSTADAIVVPDANLLFTANFSRSGFDLVLSKDGHEHVIHDYFRESKHKDLASVDGARLTHALVDALAGYTQYAQAAGSAEPPKVIGHVSKLTGTATAIRNGVAVTLNSGDNVYKGDVIQAGADSSLGLTFIDGTVFALSSNARMVLNEMVYDPNGSQNSSLLSLVAGTISFVAGETAKHGDMKVDTPVATMGIRGTAVLVEIGFELLGPLLPSTQPNVQVQTAPPVKFQVLVEPGDKVGSYILYNKGTGLPMGTVNAAGTVTLVNFSGVLGTQPAPAMTDAAKQVIETALKEFFPNYVPPTDANPKSDSEHGSSTPTGTTIERVSPGLIIEHVTTTVTTTDANGKTTTIEKVVDIPHVNTKPLITVVDVVDEPSFKIGDKVTIFDPDIGDGLFNDIPSPFNPNTGIVATAEAILSSADAVAAAELGGLIHVDSTGNVTYDEATLKSFIHIDESTGQVTYNMSDFAFLAKGEKATFTLTFKSSSGPDTLPETLKLTINGINDQPVISGNANATAEEVADQTGQAVEDKTSGTLVLTDPDLSDTHTITTTTLVASVWSRTDGATGIPNQTLLDAATAFVTHLVHDQHTGTSAINWDFSLEDKDLDFLAEGETLALTYRIIVTDSSGDPNAASQPFDVTVLLGSSNDQPVISVDASGPHTYAELPATTDHNSDIIPVTGTLLFSDADFTDTHTALATIHAQTAAAPGFVWSAGTLTAAQVTALNLASSMALTVNDSTDNKTNSLDFSYKAWDSTFDFLAKGETLTITYDVTVTDDSGQGNATSPKQTVTIVVTGTNDAPAIVAATPDPAALVEDSVAQSASLKAGGTITFQDVDLTDTHTATFALKSSTSSASLPGFTDNTTLGTFALTAATVDPTSHAVTETTSDTTNTADVGWSFTLADSNSVLQSLAKDQTLTQVYTVTVTDNNGAPVSKDVTITLKGTNDTPTIVSSTPDPAALVEDSTLPPGSLSTNGTITFQDLDLIDTHTATFALKSVNATADLPGYPESGTLAPIGTFAIDAAVTETTTDTVDTGTLGWTFTLDDNDPVLQSLAEGQTLTQVYTVTIKDNNNAPVTQDVTVTITGKNDAPTIVAGPTTAIKGVTEDADPTTLSTGGTITFRDVDLTDTHTATFALKSVNATADLPGYPESGTLAPIGTFAIDSSVTETTTDTVDTGTLGWTFTLDDNDPVLQSLAEGQTLTQIYTVTIKDNNNAPVTQDVTVTITGKNDTPVISNIVSAAIGVTEDTTAADNPNTPANETGAYLVGAGSASFADVDLLDHETATVSLFDATSTSVIPLPSNVETALADAIKLSYTTNSNAGTVNWSFALDDGLVQYLAAGESITATYKVTVTDDSGAANNSAVQQIVVTINGQNDAPVISAAALGPVSEGATDPAGASIATLFANKVTDVDHGSSFAGIAIAGNTADAQTQGVWEYFCDGVNDWIPVGTVSADHALVLEADSLLRFVPATDFNGTPPALTVYGLDDTYAGGFTYALAGTPDPVYLDATVRGDATAISALSADISTSITAVNDAPVASGSATLAAIDEDTLAPPGDTVVNLFSAYFSDAADNQTGTAANGSAADTFAGIAISAYTPNAAKGDWQYFDGVGWHTLGAATLSAAITLSDAASLRFVPAANYNGAATALSANLIETGGADITDGDTVDLTGATGGVTHYSTATVSLGETINPINDAPVITSQYTVADTLHATSLDTTKWAVYLPEVDNHNSGPADASVTPTADGVVLHDHGYLQTVTGFTPSAATPLAMTFSFVWNSGSYEYIEVTDRTDGTTDNTYGGPANGISFISVWGGLLLITDNAGNSVQTSASFTQGARYDVTVTDNGSHQTFIVRDDSTSAVVASLSSDFSNPAAGNLVTFSDREANDGIHTSTIDNVSITGGPAVLQYVENQAATAIAPALTVSDIDSSTLASATVKIAGNLHASEDVLGFINNNAAAFGNIAASAYDAANGLLTLTSAGATASVAQWQSALDAVTYFNSSDDPSSQTRTITFTLDDGAAQNNLGTATAFVDVTPVNDPPVVHGGPVTGQLAEDDTPSQQTVTGQLTSTDPDTATAPTWKVVNGTSSHPADFAFAIDNLTITRNSQAILNDPFDSAPGSQSSPFAYYVDGGSALHTTLDQANGRAILSDNDAVPTTGIGSTASYVTANAYVLTGTDPNGSTTLTKESSFSIDAKFDLILPDDLNQGYGIRLTDRQPGATVGANGDDVAELRFVKGQNGGYAVQLRDIDFTNNIVNGVPLGTATVLQSFGISPGSVQTGEQIVLHFTHVADSTAVSASYDLYDVHGNHIGSTVNFGSTDNLFSDEDFTQVQIHSFAPTTDSSFKLGTYGALSIDPTGAYTYAIQNGSNAVQHLRGGQQAQDTFTIQVSDGQGGTDTTTATFTVTGNNDAPVITVATNPTAQSEAADAHAQDISAITGTMTVSDLDVGDTLTGSVTGDAVARLNGSTTLPNGVDVSALIAASALTFNGTAASNGGAQTLTYTYDPAAANLDFLQAGDVLTITYTAKVSDGTVTTGNQPLVITINGANDAPVLDASASPSFGTIEAGATAPSGQVGVLVSSLADLTGIANVTDVDNTSVGIAITGVNADGTLWYSADNGTTWVSYETATVSDSNAILIPANSRLYFQPSADASGTISDAITFHAWDQTAGQAGSQYNITANGGTGGTTAFSTAADTVAVEIGDPGNQPPVAGADAIDITGNSNLAAAIASSLTGNDSAFGGATFAISGASRGGDTGTVIDGAIAITGAFGTLVLFPQANASGITLGSIQTPGNMKAGDYLFMVGIDANGNAIVDNPIERLLPGDAPLTDAFSYTITDSQGATSAPATVNVAYDLSPIVETLHGAGYDTTNLWHDLKDGYLVGVPQNGNTSFTLQVHQDDNENNLTILRTIVVDGTDLHWTQSGNEYILDGGTIDAIHVLDGDSGPDLADLTNIEISAVDIYNAVGPGLSATQSAFDELFKPRAYDIVGTSGADTLNGGDFNDRIDTNGGADVVHAGAGNDLILVHDDAWQSIDGGDGINTIRVVGSADLGGSNHGDQSVANIQILDLNTNAADSVRLDPHGIAQVNSDHTLRILGNGDDTVNLRNNFDGHPDGHWVETSGVSYTGNGAAFTSDVTFDQFDYEDASGTLAALYVQQGVNVSGGGPTLSGDSVSVAESGQSDGVTTVFNVSLTSDDPSSLFVTATALHGSVSPSSINGTVGAINNQFTTGVVYTPTAYDGQVALNDVVTLTVSDSQGLSDQLHFVFQQSGAGGATLDGTSGKDLIFATGGSDTLTGNGGLDNFIFSPQGGTSHDTVTDFETGLDRIDIRQFAAVTATNLSSWLADGGNVSHPVSTDTLITLDANNSILLKNVASVSVSDFIVHA